MSSLSVCPLDGQRPDPVEGRQRGAKVVEDMRSQAERAFARLERGLADYAIN